MRCKYGILSAASSTISYRSPSYDITSSVYKADYCLSKRLIGISIGKNNNNNNKLQLSSTGGGKITIIATPNRKAVAPNSLQPSRRIAQKTPLSQLSLHYWQSQRYSTGVSYTVSDTVKRLQTTI